jgi:hypothetical protein
LGSLLRPHHEWLRSNAAVPRDFVPSGGGDVLVDFLQWYGANGPAIPMAPAAGLAWAGNLPGVVLYRSGQFQVQLFLFPAGTVVKPHIHPNVDTIESHVSGHYDFRVGGVSAIPLDHLQDRSGPASRWWGRGVRVRPTDWHDLTVFDTGACFLSFQHWLRSEPSSVGDDWNGEPANPAHAKQLDR